MKNANSTPSWIDLARTVINDEATGLYALSDTIDTSFDNAVDAIHKLPGSLIITGLGKSGLIGKKIAATLTSTGTPTIFMHPVEGLHGDLGIVSHDNALLAMSKSGNTEELAQFVEYFRRRGGGTVIAMTEKPASQLAEMANITLRLPETPEACPLNLAPTTSTTMMLALGDALAMALLEARGFKAEHFAELHPAGSLGKRLVLRVEDLMHSGDQLPIVTKTVPFTTMLQTIDDKRMGMTCIVDAQGRFTGTFTDGDLRRLTLRGIDPTGMTLAEIQQATRRPSNDLPVIRSTVSPETLVVDCLDIMEKSKITQLVVVAPDNKPLGLIRQHDILAAGMA